MNFIYSMPRVSRVWNNAFARGVLDNWELSGLTTFTSGAPMGLGYSLVVAQDLTAYGVDRTGRPQLAELLRQLDQLDAPFEWVRLLYAFPEHIDDALLETAAHARRIVPYLDMPLQHVVPQILRRMGRPEGER